MDEARLRAILAKEIGCKPDDITDDTSVQNTKGFDSLVIMHVFMAVEDETDLTFSDDDMAAFDSWPHIKAIVLGEKPTTKPFLKCLVLDADGTLWQGILGEGVIEMTEAFREAQAVYRRLKERGVILALSSKNDLLALNETLDRPWMDLHYRDFAVIEAGYGSKVESLRKIAKILNIGLDSMVFVDDSDFECGAVRGQLPEVTVVQVPNELSDYPDVARQVADLFPTMVDTSKTEQYRALAAAEKTRPLFDSDEAYLASLNIEVTVHLNWHEEIDRIAELCQKSNQFNLTTHRHDAELIADFMDNDEVWSIHYRDRFGYQGLVGVIIISDHDEVDTFLLSCRVLGRGVEYAPWEVIPRRELVAWYVPTEKNRQVADLWIRLGLDPSVVHRSGNQYIGTVTAACPPYIEVHGD